MGPRPKHQPSSIDRLPEVVRNCIGELRRQGRTIDEILEHLRGLDVQVSRTALGRHVKSMAEVGEEMRRAQSMASFLVAEFGDESDDDRMARASMRVLQGAILELALAKREDEDGEPVRLSADEAKALSLSLQRLMSAERVNADRQLKIRAEAKKEAAASAAKVARASGISKETIDLITSAVLGA